MGLSERVQEKAFERRWAILAVLCFSLLVIVLDNSILNVAIPTLIDDLHATNSQVQWMVDSYTLVFAGLLLTMGALGDRYGRRGALQVGFLIFGIGSLASALVDTADQLIGTRAFMGIGGALIMPATLSIITNVFPAHERGKAIGVWAGTAGLGVALGPLAGGFLLEHFYWGSIFLVNIPIVVFGLLAGFFLIPTSKDPSAPRLDPFGAVLSIVGLSAVLYGIIEPPRRSGRSASGSCCCSCSCGGRAAATTRCSTCGSSRTPASPLRARGSPCSSSRCSARSSCSPSTCSSPSATRRSPPASGCCRTRPR
jgi:MFS family permease